MKNKVRHNTVDVRNVEVVQYDTKTTHQIHERYANLYYDYMAQQRNVYIKPKRALRAWRKAGTEQPKNGAPRTLVQPNKRILARLQQKSMLRELGL